MPAIVQPVARFPYTARGDCNQPGNAVGVKGRIGQRSVGVDFPALPTGTGQAAPAALGRRLKSR